MEKIRLINEQGIKLKGYYHKEASTVAILYIHGLTGAYDDLAQVIASRCEQEKVAFCFAYNQGAGEIKEFEKQTADGEQVIIRGSCYERFESIVPDVQCFVQFLESEGYQNIYLVGHSMGNNKLIYFLNHVATSKVRGVVLLAPQDMEAIINSDYHKALLEEAQTLINNGYGDNVLSKPFMGFCKMSANTLWQYANYSGLLSLPYRRKNGDWQLYNNIAVPKMIIIGEYDQGLDLSNGKDVYSNVNTFPNGTIVVIKDAKHTFKHHETEVADQIMQFIYRGANE